jgi:hypothetical protein
VHQKAVSRYAGFALLITALLAAPCSAVDLQEIVRRADAALKADWAADPDYAYVERDETTKGGKVSSKTAQVVYMEGSDYSMPTAIDDHPFPAERRQAELRKLAEELRRRRAEGASAREHRLAEYRKQRDENGSLLLAFAESFNFELLREETMEGHAAYVLQANPRERTGTLTRAQKVLSGMRGTVWIDKEQFHAIRAECTVFAPVPIYGALAKVLPPTSIDLRLSPATPNIWLITEFSLALNVSKVFFKSSSTTRSTYTEYRPNSVVLEELLREAGQ